MILGKKQAEKVLPLVSNIEAYEAFLVLVDVLHAQAYERLFNGPPNESIGALKVLDEMKELKVRLKDSLNSDR